MRAFVVFTSPLRHRKWLFFIRMLMVDKKNKNNSSTEKVIISNKIINQISDTKFTPWGKIKKKNNNQFSSLVKIKSKCGNVLLQKSIRYKINEATWLSHGWYLLSNNSLINQCRNNEVCEWMYVATNPYFALCNSSS